MLRDLLFTSPDMATKLANHLWQSTIFVAAVGLSTLLLRRQPAQVRYSFWLAASAKFLLPFSLLIGLGELLPKPQQPITAPLKIHSAVDVVAQPFSSPSITPTLPTKQPEKERLITLLSPALVIMWFCGAVTVLLVWYVRWYRLCVVLRRATPVEVGREIDLLRRLAAITERRGPVTLRRSSELLEPGIFGVLRPTLLWPERLSERLKDEHIEAILSHELMHVRRRDNLIAAIHMAVEALFWFNPLVWWIERRLVEERELACDEAVMGMKIEPITYVESLLKTCRFCVESPLACVSGINGVDLHRRVSRIMMQRREKQSTLSKLLLACLGVAVLAAPIVIGAINAPLSAQASSKAALSMEMPDWQIAAGKKLAFEVATVKPSKSGSSPKVNFTLGPGDVYANTGGRFLTSNISLLDYIRFAYKLTDGQVDILQDNAPKWIATAQFDIQAKSEIPNPTKDQMRLMMQSLLAERFKLGVHSETRELPVLALVLVKPGKLGPQLRPHPPEDSSCSNIREPANQGSDSALTNDIPSVCGGLVSVGVPSVPSHVRIGGRNVPLALVAAHLGGMGQYDRPIVDQTGLSGTFDLVLEWGPDSVQGSTDSPAQDDRQTILQEALKDQLGLKLEREKAPVTVLLINHMNEQPTAN